MKNKILVVAMIFVSLTFPLTAFANEQTYKPPPQKGTIYVIVSYRVNVTRPMPTRISINWGNYNHSETIPPHNKGLYPGSGIPRGVVIKLRHANNDSIEIKASSDGYVKSIYQGSEPSECSNREWKCISW